MPCGRESDALIIGKDGGGDFSRTSHDDWPMYRHHLRRGHDLSRLSCLFLGELGSPRFARAKPRFTNRGKIGTESSRSSPSYLHCSSPDPIIILGPPQKPRRATGPSGCLGEEMLPFWGLCPNPLISKPAQIRLKSA